MRKHLTTVLHRNKKYAIMVKMITPAEVRRDEKSTDKRKMEGHMELGI